ncbi:MAG: hypothetical protein ACKO25_00645 [Cyanobium sp.]
MSTSLDPSPSASISRQEYLSSLPRWRQWLAKLNWHPVVEYEIREIEFEHRRIEFERRAIEHEKRMQELRKEDGRMRIEDERRRKEDERLAELDARLDALWRSYDSNSTPPPPTPSEPTT